MNLVERIAQITAEVLARITPAVRSAIENTYTDEAHLALGEWQHAEEFNPEFGESFMVGFEAGRAFEQGENA